MANGLFGGGNGSLQNPYLIEDVADLNVINDRPDLYYKQNKNITIFKDFAPIGSLDNPFTGSYDGNHYKITIDENAFIEEALDAIGLFGVAQFATFKNIRLHGLLDARFTTDVGGIVGKVIVSARTDEGLTKILDCRVNLTIFDGGENVGGLVGSAQNIQITRCSSDCYVVGGEKVGGVAGWMITGIIEHSSVDSTIYANYQNSIVGGIVGVVGGMSDNDNRPWPYVPDVNYSYSISSLSGTYVGGIIGQDFGLSYKKSNQDHWSFASCISCYFDSGTGSFDNWEFGSGEHSTYMSYRPTYNGWSIEDPGHYYDGGYVPTWVMRSYGDYPRLLDTYEFKYGDGTEENPYQIWNYGELYLVRFYPNSYFIQKEDISMIDKPEWDPIRMYGLNYNGNNKVIKGMYLTEDSIGGYIESFGLFGHIIDYMQIKNLLLLGSQVSIGYIGYTKRNVGLLVGTFTSDYSTHGIIENCVVTGEIFNCDYRVGGIIGLTGPIMIKDCHVDVEIFEPEETLGGIAGEITAARTLYKSSTIEGCSVIVSLNKEHPWLLFGTQVGGIAGVAYDTKIEECFTAGYIQGEKKVGGIVGSMHEAQTNSFIKNCYSTCVIVAHDYATNIAGILGYSTKEIEVENCYFSGKILSEGILFTNEPAITSRSRINYESLPLIFKEDKAYFTDGTSLLFELDLNLNEIKRTTINNLGSSRYGIIGQRNWGNYLIFSQPLRRLYLPTYQILTISSIEVRCMISADNNDPLNHRLYTIEDSDSGINDGGYLRIISENGSDIFSISGTSLSQTYATGIVKDDSYIYILFNQRNKYGQYGGLLYSRIAKIKINGSEPQKAIDVHPIEEGLSGSICIDDDSIYITFGTSKIYKYNKDLELQSESDNLSIYEADVGLILYNDFLICCGPAPTKDPGIIFQRIQKESLIVDFTLIVPTTVVPTKLYGHQDKLYLTAEHPNRVLIIDITIDESNPALWGWAPRWVDLRVSGGPINCFYDEDYGIMEYPFLKNINANPERRIDLKKQETFRGWDFEETWVIDPSKNKGLPYLKRIGHVIPFYEGSIVGVVSDENFIYLVKQSFLKDRYSEYKIRIEKIDKETFELIDTSDFYQAELGGQVSVDEKYIYLFVQTHIPASIYYIRPSILKIDKTTLELIDKTETTSCEYGYSVPVNLEINKNNIITSQFFLEKSYAQEDREYAEIQKFDKYNLFPGLERIDPTLVNSTTQKTPFSSLENTLYLLNDFYLYSVDIPTFSIKNEILLASLEEFVIGLDILANIDGLYIPAAAINYDINNDEVEVDIIAEKRTIDDDMDLIDSKKISSEVTSPVYTTSNIETIEECEENIAVLFLLSEDSDGDASVLEFSSEDGSFIHSWFIPYSIENKAIGITTDGKYLYVLTESGLMYQINPRSRDPVALISPLYAGKKSNEIFKSIYYSHKHFFITSSYESSYSGNTYDNIKIYRMDSTTHITSALSSSDGERIKKDSNTYNAIPYQGYLLIPGVSDIDQPKLSSYSITGAVNNKIIALDETDIDNPVNLTAMNNVTYVIGTNGQIANVDIDRTNSVTYFEAPINTTTNVKTYFDEENVYLTPGDDAYLYWLKAYNNEWLIMQKAYHKQYYTSNILAGDQKQLYVFGSKPGETRLLIYRRDDLKIEAEANLYGDIASHCIVLNMPLSDVWPEEEEEQ